MLKDPANVPGYTQWLAQGAKTDPQWAEQHAKDVSREIYKTNPQAAEEMVRQGEKAGVKVGLYADGHQASKSVGDLLKDAKGGHLSSGADAGSEECVALVIHWRRIRREVAQISRTGWAAHVLDTIHAQNAERLVARRTAIEQQALMDRAHRDEGQPPIQAQIGHGIGVQAPRAKLLTETAAPTHPSCRRQPRQLV